MRWIRWWGLGAVVAVIAALAAFFVLLAGPLSKRAIESVATRINGAAVEVQSVDFNFSPLGVDIRGMAVTDARHPMENSIEIGLARAHLEWLPLLAGHIIISDLRLTDVAFDTERSVSGAIEKPAADSNDKDEKDAQASVGEQMIASVPSLDEVLQRQPLATDSAGRHLQQVIEQRKPEVKQSLAALPDEQQLQSYEQQINALVNEELKSVEDFQRKKRQLDELKQQLKNDKKAVLAARDVIRISRDELTQSLQALQKAPAADLAMLKEQYSLDVQGAVNISRLLWGDEIAHWANEALYWYNKARPYLGEAGRLLASDAADKEPSEPSVDEPPARLLGKKVHFPTSDPWPDFLIRSLSLSAALEPGTLIGEALNLTHQPQLMPVPAQITLETQELPGVKQLSAALVLDHRRTPAKDRLTLTARQVQLQSWPLGSQLALQSALVDVDALVMVENNALSAQADAQFKQSQFSGEFDSRAGRELMAVLASVNEFNMNAGVGGSLSKPSVSLGSDLDRRLQQALGQRLKQQQQKLQQRFNTYLNERLSQYTQGMAEEIDFFNQQDGQLAKLSDQLQELAQQQLTSYTEQKKQQAKEKSEEKRDELKDKAKDKLKSLFN